MKIALVHDQLNEFGGAERVLLAMSEIWPDAPIYTAYVRKGSKAWERFKGRDIRPSWVQHIPLFSTKLASPLRFLAPDIWNSFDFSGYDIVLGSSSWYITKGFANKGKAIEICYCHTPPRWLYGYPTSIAWQKHTIVRWYGRVIGFFMRHYDFAAAQRVDYFVANSKETKKRIEKFYRRDATVIYPSASLGDPPASICEAFPAGALQAGPPIKKSNYYLFVSRLVGGKGLSLAVEASKRAGFPLKIVGIPAGYAREYDMLKKEAGGQIEFVGYVSDEALAGLYAGARAFFALATNEDFGMTPVEAMSMGTPVIGFRGGGYTESVIDGKTGVLFDDHSVDGLLGAIRAFEKMKKDWSRACIAQAKKFSKERFKKELKEFVEGKNTTHS